MPLLRCCASPVCTQPESRHLRVRDKDDVLRNSLVHLGNGSEWRFLLNEPGAYVVDVTVGDPSFGAGMRGNACRGQQKIWVEVRAADGAPPRPMLGGSPSGRVGMDGMATFIALCDPHGTVAVNVAAVA